jgi:hypothetical protein
MEAQSSQSPLELLAQKLHQKSPIECKNEIDALSPDERIAIRKALFDLVKEETQLSEQNTRLLANCLRFFQPEEVFRFLQIIKTKKLLQQFCRFFKNKNPDFKCLIRISKILLTKSESGFLRDILRILGKEKIVIQNSKNLDKETTVAMFSLHLLEKEITSPLSRAITSPPSITMAIDLKEKILNFLWHMGEYTVRLILGIKPTETFDFHSWILKNRTMIAQYKAQLLNSE